MPKPEPVSPSQISLATGAMLILAVSAVVARLDGIAAGGLIIMVAIIASLATAIACDRVKP